MYINAIEESCSSHLPHSPFLQIIGKSWAYKLQEGFRECASLPLPGNAQRKEADSGMPSSSLIRRSLDININWCTHGSI